MPWRCVKYAALKSVTLSDLGTCTAYMYTCQLAKWPTLRLLLALAATAGNSPCAIKLWTTKVILYAHRQPDDFFVSGC